MVTVPEMVQRLQIQIKIPIFSVSIGLLFHWMIYFFSWRELVRELTGGKNLTFVLVSTLVFCVKVQKIEMDKCEKCGKNALRESKM